MVIEICNLSFTDSFLTSCSTVTQGMHEWKKKRSGTCLVQHIEERRKKLFPTLGCLFAGRAIRGSVCSSWAWDLVLSVRHT